MLPRLYSGFTLIETVIGIVVLSISLAIISTLFVPATERGADVIQQIRAAELGQSLMNEILGRSFDENSDMVGGANRCGEDQNEDMLVSGTELCTNSLGDEESGNRAIFDDVDDYYAVDLEGNDIKDSLGLSIGSQYQGYKINVNVCYDSNYDGICNGSDNNYTAKLITITVTTPLGFDISFATYKVNF